MDSTENTQTRTDDNPADVSEEIIRVLASMSSSDPSALSRQTRLFDDLAFDSTTVLEFLMQLEDTLGVEFDPFTLTPEDFETVGALLDYVTGQRGA
jgi:acyl carrier protein